MQVTLYKHVSGLYFDDPEKLILFTNKSTYDQDYARYINRASFWTGEGKTYNIELSEVLEIPLTAIATVDPVYVKTATNGRVKYYYVNSIERVQQKAQVTLTLDVFATYYQGATLDASTATVTKSTCRMRSTRLIPIPEEVAPIDPIELGTDGIGMNPATGLYFLLKLKLLTAKSISTEAYTTRLYAYRVPKPSTPNLWGQELLNAYERINNIYEVISNVAGIGLEVQIEEMLLLSGGFLSGFAGTGKFRYIDPYTAEKKEIELQAARFFNTAECELKPTYAGYNKIIIGNNEITLPAYYGEGHKITIKPVFDFSDFDLLLYFENNEPISIKDFFKVQVTNSTQETSLQTIARVVGYVTGIGDAAQSAAMSFAASGGNPAVGGAAAATAVKGATDNITGSILAQATKEALPATRFNSNAFSVYLENFNTLKSKVIYQRYYYSNNSEGMRMLKLYGTNYYDSVGRLEELLTTPVIVDGARRYVELEANFTGIPLDYAQELTRLLKSGVELIKG